MKAILVIDEMPTRCIGCPCYYEDRGRCQNTWESVEDDYARPSWCPLRPLPSFKAVDLNDTRDVVMFCHGWNTCLAEITGETE